MARTATFPALAMLALGGPSYADLITYNNEADFLDAVDSWVFEGFEGYPSSENCIGGGSSFNGDLFSVTTVPRDGGASWLCTGTTAAGLPGPTEGNSALIAGAYTGDSWFLDFALQQSITGVYFELTDAVERGDAYFLLGGIDPILIASKGEGGVNTVRFGITFDDPTMSFSLLNTGLSDGWGIDKMYFATVPEPSTLALLGIGLAGMALGKRRKRPV